jgi:FKBP-type peptidyl-prolyl cis-trans isomerase FkpA
VAATLKDKKQKVYQMKLHFFPFAVLILLLSLSSCRAENERESADAPRPARDAIRLEDENQKLGYALGQEIGEALSELKAQIDPDALLRGVEDSMLGREPLLSPAEAEQVKTSFLQRLQEQQAAELSALAEKNLVISEQFLAENKLREEVTVTDSGLQYTVLQEGTGPRPGPDNVVVVHYEGTLLDGTVFDSSRERQEPAVFMVGEVIPGWSEALQLMPVGSRYRLYIPPNLAYGEQGAGPFIAPNQVLIFEIELLEIMEMEGR